MAQYARPASDITTDWTTTPLWSKLDEVSPDDADFITGTGPTKTAEVKLSSVTDPNAHTNHIWSLRLKATGSSAAEKATVTLYQGSTSIEVLINNQTIVRNAFNLWTGTLVNAANITDYSDLRIRLVTGGSNGAAETIQCSWIEFSVPDVPATQLVIDDASHTHGADGSIDLTQHNVLAIDDAAHTNTDDGPISLTAHGPSYQLVIDDTAHTHGADGPVTLTAHEPAVQLVIDDAAHMHGADGPVTLTAHVPTFQLTIADATHTHGADGPIDLTQHNVLAIDDASHTNGDDGPITLTYHPPSAEVLTIDDAAHTNSDDGPITLTAHGTAFQLTIADATHTHGADELQLVQHNILAIDDGTHAHLADNVELAIGGGMTSDGMGLGLFVGMERKISS